MNLLSLSFLRRYLYAPMTWLHFIIPNVKVIITFCNLIILPCASIHYLLYTVALLVIIFITLKLPKNFVYSFLISLFSFIIFTFILSVNTNLSHSHALSFKNFKLVLPQYFFNSRMPTCNVKSRNSLYSLIIPEYAIRLSLISTIYLGCLKIIAFTTLYEDIIFCFYIPLKKNNLKAIREMLFISSLSSQFLEIVSIRIRNSIIAIKIRGNRNPLKNIQSLSKLYYYAYMTFFTFLCSEIRQTSSTLYSREIDQSNSFISSIYT
nr:hypothetical protein Ahn.fas.Kor.pt_226 [Ahnfeltia fastigiata]